MAGTSAPEPDAPPRPAVVAAVSAAARRAVADRADLLALSRPSSWAWTAIPFLVGSIGAEQGLSATVVLGTLFLTLPFGLLLHGVARVGATPRGAAGDDAEALAIWFAIVAIDVPFLLVLIALAGPSSALALLAMVALAFARGLAPVPARVRPVLDLGVRTALPSLAALAGLLSAGASRETVAWTAVVALGMWALGFMALQTAPALATTIGRQAPGAAALIGFGTASLLAIATGPLGALAALGVTAYLLPAAMVAGPTHGGTRDDQGDRARRELPALHVLVGGWVGALLLVHWQIVVVTAWEAAILAPAVVAGYALANIVAIRIASRRHRVRDGATTPSLAIIVTGHDGLRDPATSLAALRAQTYADTTILVVVDPEDASTASDAGDWLGDEAILVAPPRPPEWSPAGWSRHAGAMAAGTDLLLFVESATVLAPVATRILVEQLLSDGADLLSGAPKPAMPTPAERAAAPAVPLALFSFVPVWWSAITGGRPASLAFAHRGIVVVRRDAYLASGGHAADPGSPHPAVALARAVARSGRRVRVVHAARLASTRRARSLDGLIADQRRGFIAAAGGSLAGGLAVMVLTAIAFVAPALVLPMAVLAGLAPDLIAAAAVPLALLLAVRLVLAVSQHHPLLSIAWHPVTVGTLLVGQAVAIADHVRGPGRVAEAPTAASRAAATTPTDAERD